MKAFLNEVDTVLRFSSRSQTVGTYLNQIRKSNSIYFSRYGESDRDKNKGKQGGLQLVAATFKHMFERRGIIFIFFNPNLDGFPFPEFPSFFVDGNLRCLPKSTFLCRPT